MKERLYVFKLYTNWFCWQRAGLQVLIKVTSKADRLEGERKKFYKNRFLVAFLSIIKMFSTICCKVFLSIPDACNLQSAVSYFVAYSHELFVRVTCLATN